MAGQSESAGPENVPAPPPGRACHECSRKKTKCDMKHPVCGLCKRTGSVCSFPLKRKALLPQDSSARKKTQSISENLTRLVQLLEANHVVNQEQPQPQPQPHFTLANDVPSVFYNSENPPGPSDSDVVIDLMGSSRPTLGRSRDTTSLVTDFLASLSPDQTDPRFSSMQNQPPPTTTRIHFLAPQVQGLQKFQFASNEVSMDEISTPNISLVELFFKHVQPWLPILHKPSILQRYAALMERNAIAIANLPVDEALLLQSMCALSARFSSMGSLAHIPEYERGDGFASRASELYSRSRDLQTATLTNLQGCILLAFHYYTSGISSHGWLITGACVRLAYELGLSEMDDEGSEVSEGLDWVQKEEYRRAWWLVWELDTLGSILCKRPFAVDRNRMVVLLPVSDEAWFSGRETSSAKLITRPGKCWKSLCGSENQDARAWFLVANFVLSLVHNSLQQLDQITLEEATMLKSDVSCLRLARPPSLSVDVDLVTFDSESLAQKNWIVGTDLFLAQSAFLLCGVKTADCGDQDVADVQLITPLRTRALEMMRIMSRWAPEEIDATHPFFAYCIAPAREQQTGQSVDGPVLSCLRDLAALVQRRIAKKWKLGSITLRTWVIFLSELERVTNSVSSRYCRTHQQTRRVKPRRLANSKTISPLLSTITQKSRLGPNPTRRRPAKTNTAGIQLR